MPQTNNNSYTDPNNDIIFTDNNPIDTHVDTPVEDSTTFDYTPYYDLLMDEGVLRIADDFVFENTEESFRAAIAATKKNVLREATTTILASVNEEMRAVVDYALKGGTSISEVSGSTKHNIDTEVNQKETLFNYYKATTSLSDTKINTLIAKIDDPDELLAEATDALAGLKELAGSKQSLLTQKLENDRLSQEASRTDTINKLNSTIEEYTTDTKYKNKLKGFFFNEVYSPEGTTTEFSKVVSSILTNPAHTIQLADVLINYDPKKGIDFARFETKGASKANQSLRTLLSTATTKTNKSNQAPLKEDFNWEDYLNI